MQANGTKGRRAILALFGAALLGTSMFGGRFPELLKELVKRFGSQPPQHPGKSASA
jgi:hypothetical protein